MQKGYISSSTIIVSKVVNLVNVFVEEHNNSNHLSEEFYVIGFIVDVCDKEFNIYTLGFDKNYSPVTLDYGYNLSNELIFALAKSIWSEMDESWTTMAVKIDLFGKMFGVNFSSERLIDKNYLMDKHLVVSLVKSIELEKVFSDEIDEPVYNRFGQRMSPVEIETLDRVLRRAKERGYVPKNS